MLNCVFAGIAERAYLLCPGRSRDGGKCSNKLGKLCSLKVHGVMRCLAKWKLDEIKFVNEGRLCCACHAFPNLEYMRLAKQDIISVVTPSPEFLRP